MASRSSGIIIFGILVVGAIAIGIPENNLRSVVFVTENIYAEYTSFNIYFELLNGGSSPVTLSDLEVSIYLVTPDGTEILFGSGYLQDAIYLESGKNYQNNIKAIIDLDAVIGSSSDTQDVITSDTLIIVEMKGTGRCQYWTNQVTFRDEVPYYSLLQ